MEPVALLIGILIGLLVGLSFAFRPNKELKIMLQIELDATKPVKITATGKDSEGNEVSLEGYELALTVADVNGDFGTINDEMDTFNPGSAGASGTIRGSVEIGGTQYVGEVGVTLVAGGLSEIALEFAPVEAPPSE